MIDIQITENPLDLSTGTRQFQTSGCGAQVSFCGTVREITAGKKVTRLEYECYYPMAVKEMEGLATEICSSFEIEHILIHHRTGTLEVGEAAVWIDVRAPHRAPAFAACQYAIDQLKTRIPIWKKEVFDDGETWVSAHA
jgi:molybdopterin synthase catalytic subunit